MKYSFLVVSSAGGYSMYMREWVGNPCHQMGWLHRFKYYVALKFSQNKKDIDQAMKKCLIVEVENKWISKKTSIFFSKWSKGNRDKIY